MAAINITTDNFQKNVINETKPVLVDFWAPWCTYCRRIGPAFDKIADQYQDTVQAAKLNVDEARALAEEYQVEVIPTLILFRDGRPVDRIVAPDSKAKIEEFLRKYVQI